MFSEHKIDELRREYYAEISRLVDNVEVEIEDGNITSQDEARSWLDEDIETSEWTEGANQIATLFVSPVPCIGFNYEHAPPFVRQAGNIAEGAEQPVPLNPLKDDAPFPFTEFAYRCMRYDVNAELERRRPYNDLGT